MKKNICILYASHDGQTKKICEYITKGLATKGATVEICAIHDFKKPINQFDSVVIGASIRYGKHDDHVSEFINENLSALSEIKTAFFSVNLVARKEEKNSPTTNPYYLKFMESINWKPDLPGVFAGRLDYKAYSFLDGLMIKLIMLITKGPTRTDTPIEYTDWKKVDGFAEDIIRLN